jgi:BirA family biotin operon repressor/biotin-[acetyl-CoA-carboxylase] ligase
VTAAAAVAVVEACARTAGVWATIKWPNDILIRGRKVCGLLAESGTLGDSLQFIVLGVGLNVNHKRSDFPPEIAGEATSLKEAGGHALDRALVLQAFIESFEPLYDRLEAGEVVHVRREWLARDGIMGRRVRITDPRSEFEGKAVDLAADGALIVERDRGGRVEVRAAEVRLVRDIEPEV